MKTDSRKGNPNNVTGDDDVSPHFWGFDVYTFKGRAVYYGVSITVTLLAWWVARYILPDVRNGSLLKNDPWMSLRFCFAAFVCLGQFGSIIIWVSIVRASCRVQGGTRTGFAPLVVDYEVKRTAFIWAGATVVVSMALSMLFGAGHSVSVAMFAFTFSFGVMYLLPRSAVRWYPANGRQLVKLAVRGYLFSALFGAFLPNSMPLVVSLVDPKTLVLIYPLYLSFMEFLAVTLVLNDNVVEGHSPASLAIVGRTLVATFESSRIGMLVVLTNTGGRFEDFVTATIWGAVLEAVTRHDMIAIPCWAVANLVLPKKILLLLAGGVHNLHSDSDAINHPTGGDLPPSSPPVEKTDATEPLPGFIRPRMERFKRVYLGCKTDTEYWGGLMLLFMKLSNWGYPTVNMGVDEETGELSASLRPGWDMLALVLAGELFADGLSTGLGYIISRWAPSLSVHAPNFLPGRNIFIHIGVWQSVGVLYMLGMGSMEQLQDHQLGQNE